MNLKTPHNVPTFRYRLLLAGLVLLLTASATRVYADQVITLEQVLAVALEKNQTLLAGRSEKEAADARVTQATASYYPQLTATAGYDHIWIDTLNTITNRDVTDDYDEYSAGFSVSQYIYDFGKTSSQVEKSRQNLEASKKSLQVSEKMLIRDVKQAYYEILKNQQLLVVDQENVTLREQQLAQAKALYDQGMRPRIDVTRAQVQISQAQLSLLNARYSLKRSSIAMETLLGGPPVSGPYSFAEENPPLSMPQDLDSLVDLAIQSRPELTGLDAQINAAQADVKAARRSAYPNLSANGSYYKSGETFPLEDDHWQVSINLNLPLFTGFRRTGQVSESEANVNRLNALLSMRKLAVIEEVTRAFLSVQASREAISTSEIALRQAKENLAMAEGRYKTGVSDAIELSDAQLLYTESRSSLVQAVYEQYKAVAELEFAVGGKLEN